MGLGDTIPHIGGINGARDRPFLMGEGGVRGAPHDLVPHLLLRPADPQVPHPLSHTPQQQGPGFPHEGAQSPQPPMAAAPQTLSSLCTAVYCGQGALLCWGRGAAASGGPDPASARGSHPRLLHRQPGVHEARGEGAAVAGGPDASRRGPAWRGTRHMAHGAWRTADEAQAAGGGQPGGTGEAAGAGRGRGAGARCPVPANWCPAGRWASGARCRWGARAPRRSRRVAALGTRNEASAPVALGTAERAGGGGDTPRTPSATVLLLPRLLLVTLCSLGVLGDL